VKVHKNLSKSFEPEKVEKRWYPHWENNGVFSWSKPKTAQEKFNPPGVLRTFLC
jgi:valyl-tRNA synthetase